MGNKRSFLAKYNHSRIFGAVIAISGIIVGLGIFIGNSPHVDALPAGAISLPAPGSTYSFTSTAGGTVTVRVDALSPTTPQGAICDGGRKRPNFSYHLSDTGLILGASSSLLTYDLNFSYKECGQAIKNYAIYSSTYCDLAGNYGAGVNGNAFDCVKYAEGPPDSATVDNPALGCPVNGPAELSKGGGPPTNNRCTQSIFQLIRKNTPAPYSPGGSLQSSTVADSTMPKNGGAMNGLGQDTNSSGDRQFNANICQYWKYTDNSADSDSNGTDDDCKPISFNISWTYAPPPSYDLSATVTDLLPTFPYYTDAPTTWGMVVNSGAHLPAEGIGYHEMDVWRVVYPGTAPGWTDGTITGDAGICPNVAALGAVGCDRLVAYGCPSGPPASCGTLSSAGQYWNWFYNGLVGPYPVGTNVCYISRVSKPTVPSTLSDWKTSRQVCTVSAKSPKTQFLGGDVRIAGRATSYYTQINGGNRYGSWGEYGVFASDVNQNLASGGSLRNGSSLSDDDLNKLSFQNMSYYGSYGTVPSSRAYAYFDGLAATGGGLNQANPTSGVYDVTDGTTINMPNVSNGQSVIIRAKNGTIRISGMGVGIGVPNTGVTGPAGMGQVVILAKNILIDETVDRVDAWLVTPTDPLTPLAGGTIDTCYRGGDPTLNSSICSAPLTVNGPIYTSNLKLRRTAGADNDTPAQLSATAEKFNLRADSQLWAYTYANRDDFAKTDFIQELPPRY